MKTNIKHLKIKTVLPKAIIVIGILLLAMKVYADSEPGAVPLLLIAVGTGWYFIQRAQMRSRT